MASSYPALSAATLASDELMYCPVALPVGGIVLLPIRSIDEREIGEPGPVTKKIQEVFFAVAQGEVERYGDWLEYVN